MDDGDKTKDSGSEPNNALAARRARLRPSLTKQNLPAVDPSLANPVPEGGTDNQIKSQGSVKVSTTSGGRKPASSAVAGADDAVATENKTVQTNTKTVSSKEEGSAPVADWGQNPRAEKGSSAPTSSAQTAQAPASGHNIGSEEGQGSAQALELLSNIDHALSSCATHLASLQKVAGKQIDELKLIAETLQSHSFSEIGLNINTLMESFTAAIEPMKAIGELVPALDRLASASELKEYSVTQPELTEKQMVANLADQLVAGIIDPWIFKSAYQAIFPDDDFIALLHRLGELLGEQQLSGELFQAAYDALQLTQSRGAMSTGLINQVDNSRIDQQYDQGLSEDINLGDQEEMVDQPMGTASSTTEKEEELSRQLLEREEELSRQLLEREEELSRQLLEREEELSRQLSEKIKSLKS